MDHYERFRQMLDLHPAGAPPSSAIDEILRILFSAEEIALAVHMNFHAKPAAIIAENAQMPLEDVERLLEAMADKAVIFCKDKNGDKLYGLVPTIPGLFEFPFMTGGGSPMHKRLGELWQRYHHEGLGEAFGGSVTPLMRVVPVEKSITREMRVYPYEEVAMLIEKSKAIAVTNCACRVSVGKCDKPLEVCLIFDSAAEFLAQRGHARLIDRDEAKQVLDLSEKEGLVHTSNNSRDRANMICNCCPCCCTVLRGRTELHLPNAFAVSGYLAQISEEFCLGCGTCADVRCPMEAIEMVEEVAKVDEERCIGCGLCVSTCQEKAIRMVRRTDPPEVCVSIQEMALKILQEKGKLAEFAELMQK